MYKQKLALICKIICACIVANLFVLSDAVADEPFIGEIRPFPYTYCPRGWAETNGQLLPIAQNTALFAVLGTIYGGDGRTTLALPDLRARTPMGTGTGPGLTTRSIGQRGGQETVSIGNAAVPNHSHGASTTTTIHATSADGNSPTPTGAILADDGRDRIYNSESPDVTLHAGSVVSTTTLGNAGTQNPALMTRRQPFIAMRYCIALVGLFPSRS